MNTWISASRTTPSPSELDPRLRGNGGLNQTCVKAHAGVIDEELVGPSDAGQASVFVHPHKVVGVEIILSVNLFQFKEHGVVQPSAAHRGRRKIQHARTRSVRKIVELLFVFRENFDFEARQREADGVIIPVRGGDDTRAAQLRHSVPVDNPGGGTVGPQIVVEALLEFGGNIGAAHEHKLHLGQIDIGHRLVPGIQNGHTGEENANADDDRSLPLFTKGESGPHIPSLTEKWTQPPKPYTEATLLRAMETAGKFVDNEELRDAMKENGIGRPSTRAAIIETLFKRRYIRKERKSLVATPTGVELIGIIHEELLKSAELTGIWEKKLREIEKKQYDAQTFIAELKQMVTDIINQVRSDHSNRQVSVTTEEDLKKKKVNRQPSADNGQKVAGNVPAGFQPQKKTSARKTPKKTTEEVKAAHNPDEIIGMPCPLCKKGHIIKGKAAYGCSRWKEGCTYRLPFDQA